MVIKTKIANVDAEVPDLVSRIDPDVLRAAARFNAENQQVIKLCAVDRYAQRGGFDDSPVTQLLPTRAVIGLALRFCRFY